MERGPNILIAFRIRDEESREYIRHRLIENCSAIEITRSIYEIDSSDWEEGEWDYELAYIEEAVDPRYDFVHIWYAVDGELVRHTLGGNKS